VKKVLEKQDRAGRSRTKGQELKPVETTAAVQQWATGKAGKRDSYVGYFPSRKLRRALAGISDKP